jgi:hypothetical protein
MSWELIKSIQKATDLRLIQPFGLNLRLGDVIGVGENGEFTLEGTCESLLGIKSGSPRPPVNGLDLMVESDKGVKCEFRAAGTASALFPKAPSTNAGFDITFGSENQWVLALIGRSLTSLDQINRFRLPILNAYHWKVWKPDWALVISIATVKKMTLLASSTRNTTLALSLSGNVNPTAPVEVNLTAGASIMAQSQQIIQCVTTEPITAFCSAIRVRDNWWSNPEIGSLDKLVVPNNVADVANASEQEFWQDMDDFSP